MSESASFQYALEQQRRRALALERIRETTQSYLLSYRDLLSDLGRQDLRPYVLAEAGQVEAVVAQVQALLEGDPEEARRLSLGIAERVFRLPAVAREARRAAEEMARERAAERAREREASHDEWSRAIGDWSDPLALAMAHADLAALRSRFFRGGEALATRAEVARAVEQARVAAVERADRHREAAGQAVAAETARVVVSETVRVLQQGASDPGAVAEMAEQVRQDCQGRSGAALAEALTQSVSDADAAEVDERCRREAVRAVIASLRATGFVVDAPFRTVGERDEVVVRASKPAGARAEFRVTVAGDLTWHFDKYAGATCKRDIAVFLPKLQDVYGVKLSNERVLWQNPDDRSASVRPVPETASKERGHEQA